MRTPSPSDTAYAVLGLMAIRPWSTYELVGQSERSLRWFFPRAERGVYREAKRLADWGWAEADHCGTGRRPRTVYRITAEGRAALQEWIARECTPTQISSEAALKVFLSDQAPPEVLPTTIAGVRRSAETALEQLGSMAETQSEGRTDFPERALPNALAMRLITDIQITLRDWAVWAAKATEPGTVQDESSRERLARGVFRSIAGTRKNRQVDG